MGHIRDVLVDVRYGIGEGIKGEVGGAVGLLPDKGQPWNIDGLPAVGSVFDGHFPGGGE
jgi:hypothetical protein